MYSSTVPASLVRSMSFASSLVGPKKTVAPPRGGINLVVARGMKTRILASLAGGAITDGMMHPPCLTLDLLALYMMPDYLNWA